MKREVSFDNYVAMCDRYEEAQFKCGDWWPSVIDIKTKIEPKIEQNLEFLIWIAETADKPKTDAQKESCEYINNLLKKTLVFTDNDNTENSTEETEELINEELDVADFEDEDIEEVE